jgi:hypothetical protein
MIPLRTARQPAMQIFSDRYRRHNKSIYIRDRDIPPINHINNTRCTKTCNTASLMSKVHRVLNTKSMKSFSSDCRTPRDAHKPAQSMPPSLLRRPILPPLSKHLLNLRIRAFSLIVNRAHAPTQRYSKGGNRALVAKNVWRSPTSPIGILSIAIMGLNSTFITAAIGPVSSRDIPVSTQPG